MKGTLPKPTLLELDEYDINQRVIEALTTTCSHAVLFSIVNVEKDVVEIASELQISLSTTYKSLTNLEKLSLVEIQRFKITDDGKKIKMYRSRIEKADISTTSFSTFTIENNTACEQVVVSASITR